MRTRVIFLPGFYSAMAVAERVAYLDVGAGRVPAVQMLSSAEKDWDLPDRSGLFSQDARNQPRCYRVVSSYLIKIYHSYQSPESRHGENFFGIPEIFCCKVLHM